MAIHVRVGDFAKEDRVLPVSYYADAIKALEEQVQNPKYYVFTDDPTGFKEYFKIDLQNFKILAEDHKFNAI